MVQVLPVLLDASKSRDPNLQQCAVYGLGVLAQHRPKGFRQIAATAIQTLLNIISSPDSRCLKQLTRFFKDTSKTSESAEQHIAYVIIRVAAVLNSRRCARACLLQRGDDFCQAGFAI